MTPNSILGNIVITGRPRTCNAGWHFSGLWCQHHGGEIYAIDDSDSLQVIRWPDIEAGDYACNRVIDGGVEDFCVAAGRRAILYVDGSLRVDGRPASNILATRINVKWTIVTKAARYWLVSGNQIGDKVVVLVCLSRSGKAKHHIDIQATCHKNEPVISHEYMYSLKVVYERSDRAVILAIERDGICHLISISQHGRFEYLQRLCDIVNTDMTFSAARFSVITAACSAEDKEGEIFIAGYRWIRKINFLLK